MSSRKMIMYQLSTIGVALYEDLHYPEDCTSLQRSSSPLAVIAKCYLGEENESYCHKFKLENWVNGILNLQLIISDVCGAYQVFTYAILSQSCW